MGQSEHIKEAGLKLISHGKRFMFMQSNGLKTGLIFTWILQNISLISMKVRGMMSGHLINHNILS
jgi:hypothetical protein